MTDASVRAEETEDSERRFGQYAAYGLPSLGVVATLAVFGVSGLGPALLTLAGTAFVGTIALFWASLRTLSGDAPLSDAMESSTNDRAGGRSRLREKKRELLRSLKDLAFEHEIGKIDDADYGALASRVRDEAKTVMRAMDDELGPLRERAEELARAHLLKRGLAAQVPAVDAETGDGGAAELSSPAKSSVRPAQTAPRLVCAGCATSNEPDATFCKKCGASVQRRACPGCFASNEPDAAFCKKCREPLSNPSQESPRAQD